MKKLFKKVSAIALSACMALSASAVALAGWTDDVYTPTVDTETTVYNWSSAYGADGYILLANDDTSNSTPVIYSDMYQDSAYTKDATFSNVESTKGKSNMIQGGLFADSFYNYRGYFYAYAQAGKAWAIIQENGGATLADSTYRSQIGANAEAKADLTTNGTCEGGLLTTAPISYWGISGTTLSNVSGHTQWMTPAGDIVNVRIQSGNPAYPYTLAFNITEGAVEDGGIYVTVRTYNMKSGNMMLKNKWYANNDDKSIAEGSVEAIQTVSVTGDRFVTFYIETAGEYTIIANDTANQEGITGIFFDKSEPIPAPVGEYSSTYTTAGSAWEGYFGEDGYFIAAHDGTTKGAYIGGLVEGIDGKVITATQNGQILPSGNWNGALASLSYASATWTNNASTMSCAPYAPGTTDKTLGRVHSNSEEANIGAATEQGGGVIFSINKAGLDKAEAATGERAIYVTVLEPHWNKVTTATNFTSKLYYATAFNGIYTQTSTNYYSTSSNYYNANALVSSHTDVLSTTEGLYVTYKVTVEGYYGITMIRESGRQGGMQAVFVDYVNPVDNFESNIAVDLAGGSFATGDSIPATYNPLTMESGIVLPTPVKEGHTFAGWKVNGADAVLDYTITSANVGDLSLVATWKPIDEFVSVDNTSVNNWEGVYGVDGYVVLANVHSTFYSDMYSDYTGTEVITGNRVSYAWVYMEGSTTDTGIKADAPITRWGYNGGSWQECKDAGINATTLYAPGTTTPTNTRAHNSANAPWPLAMMFTTNVDKPVYVTVYMPKAFGGAYSEDTPVTLALYSYAKAGQVSVTNPYDANYLEASCEIVDNTGVYATFLIRNSGDYMLSLEGANTQTVKGMFGGLFFDYIKPEIPKTLTVDKADGSEPTITKFKSYSDDIALETPSRVGYTFAGWVVNGAEPVMDYTLDCSEATANVSVVATWTATEYAISVNLNGGEATIPATYTIEDVIVLPTPEKNGYDFAGWKVNGADAVMEYTIENATGAIDLVATWTATEYAISVNLNGGEATIVDKYTVESADIVLPTPTKLGATFAGWKVNGADAVMEYTIATGSTGAISLEATWTLDVYTITTNLNGGEATIPNSYTIDDVIVLPTPVKTGYTFAGWKVNGADAVAEYTIENATGAITLEATWTINTYTITTTLNGGTATVVDTYTIESADIVLPTPVKNGYTFAGWKVNGADAVMEYTIATGSTGDITLEATWTAVEYDITVNLNGGEATIVDKYTIEDVIVLPTPAKNGYTFAGWKVNGADAVAEYTIANATGAITLEATWTVNIYNITTNLNGGEATVPATYTIESAAIVLPTPEKNGYTFAGWKVNGADAVAEYTIATGSTGAITLEATWTATVYDITTNLNGGTATIPATYTIESDAIVLPTPVKNGYTFAGWKVNGADAVANYTIATGSTGDIALEATWTINTYTITTTLNGGAATVADNYTVESADIVLPTPVKTGYTFAGWKVNGADAVANYTIATGTTGDITLEATWTINTYTITTTLNGGTATVVDNYTVESADIVLPTPVKTGYTFAGWKVNGANAVANYTIATGTTGDITLEATWTAIEYAINVVLGDGSLDASVTIPATYTIESAAIVIDAVPTLEGYNFVGWKVGDAEPVSSYTIPAGSTGDITITAVYEEKAAAGCGGAIAMLSAFMGLIALAVIGKKY